MNPDLRERSCGKAGLVAGLLSLVAAAGTPAAPCEPADPAPVKAEAVPGEKAAGSDPARLLALAGQAGEGDARRLRHKALRLLLEEKQDAPARELHDLARRVTELLPEAVRPAPAGAEGLAAAYEQDPEGTYAHAPAPDRSALDRRLFTAVLARALGREIADRPREAFALACRAVASLPDRPDLARELLAAGARAQQERLAVLLTAPEVTAALGPPQRVARQVVYRRYVEQWLYDRPVPLCVVFECVRGQEPQVLTAHLLRAGKP